MIQRVYEQCLKSKLISHLIVATDDKRIYDHVNNFGGNVVMTKEDHNSGTERCGEVIEKHNDYDIVINIQGDEPLISPEQFDSVLKAFERSENDIVTLVKEMSNIEDVLNPNRVKVVLDNNNNGMYFSRSPIPYVANQNQIDWLTQNKFWKHIGIYAWRMETLKSILKLEKTKLEQIESLEQLRWLYHGFKIKTVKTTIETPNIDVPEDLKKVLTILDKK